MEKLTAEEIFKSHSCSRAMIYREGYLDDYKALGGGERKLEKQWRSEYIEHWFTMLDETPFQASIKLSTAYADEIVYRLIDKYEFKDDYVRLECAALLLDFAQLMYLRPLKRARARRKAVALLNGLLVHEIELTSESRKHITTKMLLTWRANSEEEFIRIRSQRLLRRRKFGSF